VLFRFTKSIHADAAMGIDIDYETVGQGSMLMVTTSGRAVRLKRGSFGLV
jgi:uncharacterized protein YbjQ (UPF0145 family)